MFGNLSRLARTAGLVGGAALLMCAGPVSVAPAAYAASGVVAGEHAMSTHTPMGPGNALSAIICHPGQTNDDAAFPLNGSTGAPPPSCDGGFKWGYTVSGNASGQAEWDSPFVGSWTCTAQAWIPDSHSNDPNAQYYLFDGGHYLANDAFVNQENVTNNWTDVSNGTWFTINDQMRVTLSDHNPIGQANWQIAAYAIQFFCY